MRVFLMSASAVAIAMSGGTAHAQQAETDAAQATTTDPVDTADGEEAGVIVVTAERRNTSLQRAPVAATVLTGEDLVRKAQRIAMLEVDLHLRGARLVDQRVDL